MPNQVRTEFVIVEGDAPRKVRQFENNLNNLADAGGNSLNRITDFANSTADLRTDFAADLTRDFDKLSAQTISLETDFKSLASQRLNGGNIGNLTKEIVRASERSRQLSTDILNIQRELANPNRKSSIGFLTDELKAAEREADSLNRKLNNLPVNVASNGGDTFTKRFGTSSRLSTFQKQNLSYQVNDVLTGLASGQNPTQILAQQGGQIAQIFDPAQLAAFTAKYAGLVTVLGAGAAALALTYKITGDIRAEAERRLKNEELITAATNKQFIAQKENLKTLKDARAEAERGREFARQLERDSVEQLERRRATLLEIARLSPGSPNINELTSNVLGIDAQLANARQGKTAAADASFNQRAEDFRRTQEAIRESERRLAEDRLEREKKRKEDVDKAKEQVKDLGRTYNDVFSSLYQKSNNPFVSVFSEGDKAITDLRKNLAGLAPELKAIAVSMQQKLNADSLFNARLENDFAAFDLRQNAGELRNFKPAKIEDQSKFFNDFIADGLKQISAANGGGFTRFNLTGAGASTFGFSQSDARNDLLNVYERIAGGGSISRQKTFQDLSDREKFDFANRENLGLQTRLGATFDLAKNRNALNDEQQSAIDRKIIALSSGVRPEQFTDAQRDLVATANEKEAARRESAEARAQASRDAQTALQTRIATSNERLIAIAEREGTKGIENLVKIVDETNGSVKVTARPSANDTARYYDPDFSFGGGGGFSNR